MKVSTHQKKYCCFENNFNGAKTVGYNMVTAMLLYLIIFTVFELDSVQNIFLQKSLRLSEFAETRARGCPFEVSAKYVIHS